MSLPTQRRAASSTVCAGAARLLAFFVGAPALALVAGACHSDELPRSNTERVTASTSADWSVFTLGPNDLVYVGVFGQPELSPPPTGIRVAPDGTLSLPLLGGVPVSGLSPEEARRAIEAGLSRYVKNPSVAVSVLEYSSRRFYLFGEVLKPGPYPMDRPITALEALSHGEGLTPGASRERAAIVRRHPNDEVEVIPFNAAVPGPDGLVQVLPDDLVFVAQSGAGWFAQHVTPYLQGLGFTLSQVASIALAYDRLYNE